MTEYRIYVSPDLCYDLNFHGQTTQNKQQNYWHDNITPKIPIKDEPHIHRLTTKTHKINVGGLIWY